MSFVDIETRVLSLQTLMQVTAESSSSDELNQLGADLGLAGSFPETQDNRAFDRTIVESIISPKYPCRTPSRSEKEAEAESRTNESQPMSDDARRRREGINES
jgi:hypothetical protein